MYSLLGTELLFTEKPKTCEVVVFVLFFNHQILGGEKYVSVKLMTGKQIYKESPYPIINSISNALLKLFPCKLSMYVNWFNLHFPSTQNFNANCFFHIPFQVLPNLTTRERPVDKVKVWSEPDSYLCMDHVVNEHEKPSFLFGGATSELGNSVCVLLGTQRHSSQLEQS